MYVHMYVSRQCLAFLGFVALLVQKLLKQCKFYSLLSSVLQVFYCNCPNGADC